MKVIKVVYNNESKHILNAFQDLSEKAILESFNYDYYKDKKRAISIMTTYGTKELPLIVFEDENLDGYAAIWKEDNLSINNELINKFLKLN